MRTFFPVAAVALLVALGPAYAANPPKDNVGKTTLRQHRDTRPGMGARVNRGDDTTDVIILDRDSLEALPNPYSNPAPRMISDVWAMRT